MMRRRRPLVRAAMIGGGAYAAGKHHERGQQAEADQEQRLEALEQQQAQPAPVAVAPAPPPPPPPAPAAAAPVDIATKLTELKSLLDAGALTQDEFDTAKGQLLRG